MYDGDIGNDEDNPPMSQSESDKRNFVEVTEVAEDGDTVEGGVFTGRTPRQAALKIARRLDPVEGAEDGEEAKQAGTTTIRIRERGTQKLHVYEGWAWIEEAPDPAPGLGDTYTAGNVSKTGIEKLDEDD